MRLNFMLPPLVWDCGGKSFRQAYRPIGRRSGQSNAPGVQRRTPVSFFPRMHGKLLSDKETVRLQPAVDLRKGLELGLARPVLGIAALDDEAGFLQDLQVL